MAVIRYSKITLKGTCLEPELIDGEQVDGLVDFRFEDIEVGDYVLFTLGGIKNVKKVFALASHSFLITEEELISNNKKIKLGHQVYRRFNNPNNIVPEDTVIVCSNLNYCREARVVHRGDITRLIKRPRGGFIINSS